MKLTKKIVLAATATVILSGCFSTPKIMIPRFDTSTPQGQLGAAMQEVRMLDINAATSEERIVKWEELYSHAKKVYKSAGDKPIIMGNGMFTMNRPPHSTSSKIDEIAFGTAYANASFDKFERAEEIINENIYKYDNGVKAGLKANFDAQLFSLLTRIYNVNKNTDAIVSACREAKPLVLESLTKETDLSKNFLTYSKDTSQISALLGCAEMLFLQGNKQLGTTYYASLRDYVLKEINTEQSSKGFADFQRVVSTFKNVGGLAREAQSGLVKIKLHPSKAEHLKRVKKLKPLPPEGFYANVLIASLLTTNDIKKNTETVSALNSLVDIRTLNSENSEIGNSSEIVKSQAKELYLKKLAIYYLSIGQYSAAAEHFSLSIEGSNEKLKQWSLKLNESVVVALLEKRRETLDILLSSLAKGYQNNELNELAFRLSGTTKNIETNLNTYLSKAIYSKGNNTDINTFNQMMALKTETESFYIQDGSKEAKKKSNEIRTKMNQQINLLRQLGNKYENNVFTKFDSDVNDLKDIKKIEKGINADSIFIDYVMYNDLVIDPLHVTKANDAKRYGAFVVNHGKIKFIDLGKVSDIGPIHSQYMSLIAAPISRANKKQYMSLSNDLYQLLLKPILESYKNTKNSLIVAPIGDLSNLPFEALLNEQGNMVIENHLVKYVTSARALLNDSADDRANSREAVIISEPQYGEVTDTQVISNNYAYTRNRRNGLFLPLIGSDVESDFVSKALKSEMTISTFKAERATEKNLLNLNSPSILHIATHGFAVKAAEQATFTDSKQNIIEYNSDAITSGIALTGANFSIGDTFADDGIVNWYELASMNLSGTKMVVMSACETAIGENINGQASSGMRRAIEIAGAESSVTTLWAIPNVETIDLIVDFYDNNSKGKSFAESLRDAKLELIKVKSDPYYWAAFILTESSVL